MMMITAQLVDDYDAVMMAAYKQIGEKWSLQLKSLFLQAGRNFQLKKGKWNPSFILAA